MEEGRRLAERLVLGLVNRKAIRPDDFVIRNEGETGEGRLPVSMKPNAARALIAAYQRQLEEQLVYPPTGLKTAVRWIIHSQCRHCAESLTSGQMYTPFQLPR